MPKTGRPAQPVRDIEPVALTCKEAAIALKVTTWTVHKLIREGRIKAGRLGGYVYRIHMSEIERFLLADDAPRVVKKPKGKKKVAARAA